MNLRRSISSAGAAHTPVLAAFLLFAANAGAQDWNPVPGTATQVSLAFDGSAFAVDAAGKVSAWNGRAWVSVPGQLMQVSAASATNVWGVNQGNIWRWDGANWTGIPGQLKQVSAASDGTVWGTNSNDAVWQYAPAINSWTLVPGQQLKTVAVGNSSNIWGIKSDGTVYRWDGTAFALAPGVLSDISVGKDGSVWGVNSAGTPWRWNGTGWDKMPGVLNGISAASYTVAWGVGPGPRTWSFVSKPNVVSTGGCLVSPDRIFQAGCDSPNGSAAGPSLYPAAAPALKQLEKDSVSAWLAYHKLPPSDSDVIYKLGRSDLHNELRAMMLTSMIAISQKAPADLTPNEKLVYDWMQTNLQSKEIDIYSSAVADGTAWTNDQCNWRPDPEVAAIQGFEYDPTPFCSHIALIDIFQIAPKVPSRDYLMAAAMKKVYGNLVAQFPGGASALLMTTDNITMISGLAAAPVAAAVGTVALVYNFAEYIAPFAFRAFYVLAAVAAEGTETAVAGATGAAASLGAYTAGEVSFGFAAGPAAIILFAIEIGVEAGLQVMDAEADRQAIADLRTELATLQATPLDLKSFLQSSVGLYKLNALLIAASLPETPSQAPLPQHRDGVDPIFAVKNGSTVAFPTTFEYTDYNGTTLDVYTYGGWFVQTGTLSTGEAVSSISTTLRIVGADNVTKWQASRIGNLFLMTKKVPGDNDTICTTPSSDAYTGDPTNCSSYMTKVIPMANAEWLTLAEPPVFTSPSGAALKVNQIVNFTPTASGNPAPTISMVGGTLPTGVTFSTLNNQLIGFPFLGTEGNYAVTFKASNGTGSATQTVQLVVGGSAPVLDSTSSVEFFGGIPAKYTLTASGNPTPALSFAKLPSYSNITLVDNHDGTGTLSGTYFGGPTLHCEGPSGYVPAPECNSDYTLVATNAIGTATKLIHFNMHLADPAQILNPSLDTVTFVNGTQNSYLITTTGATTPVHITVNPGTHSLPPGLVFQDNHNGTAVIFTTGPVPVGTIDFGYNVATDGASIGSGNIVTIKVTNQPIFTSANTTAFLVGQPAGTFTVANAVPGATISCTGTLPKGVTFTPGANGGVLAGKPQPGSGGAYPLTFRANAGFATYSQAFTLYVGEAPTITSSANCALMVGATQACVITASGYPRANMRSVPAGAPGTPLKFAVPTNLAQLPPGVTLTQTAPPSIWAFIDLTGLNVNGVEQALAVHPAPLDASATTPDPNLTPLDYAVISGVPAAAVNGSFGVTVTADNGIGPSASQVINMSVRNAGDANSDKNVDCNDVAAVKAKLGIHAGHPDFDQKLDLNGDSVIDALDVAFIFAHKKGGGLVCQ